MKLLMIGPFPPILNGVTVSNDFLYRWLISKGAEVAVINTETGKIASRQGDKLSLSKIITFSAIYWSIFKIHGKGVIYMTIGQTFWGLTKYSPFILYCNLLGKPYVLHVHGGYLCQAYKNMSPVKKYIFRFLFERSKAVITLSTSLAEDVKKTFPESKVEIVENFYDPRLIEAPVKRELHEEARFIFLSNLMLGKGILDFLDALLLLKNDKQLLFKVAIAGSVEKGIGEILERKITALGDSVHFYGVADFEKKKELLYWSDIFVLPTWYIMEGQPLSIIEAYVTGNVVVSTHQGGIKDISGYDTFFKVEAQNPLMVSEKLIEVNQQLAQLNQPIHDTQRAAQKRFDPEVFLGGISAILHKIAAKS